MKKKAAGKKAAVEKAAVAQKAAPQTSWTMTETEFLAVSALTRERVAVEQRFAAVAMEFRKRANLHPDTRLEVDGDTRKWSLAPMQVLREAPKDSNSKT